MLTETSVCGLIHHKVLRLNQHEVTQERSKEQRQHHRNYQRQVKQNLSCYWICMYDQWKKAGCFRIGKSFLRNDHVNI